MTKSAKHSGRARIAQFVLGVLLFAGHLAQAAPGQDALVLRPGVPVPEAQAHLPRYGSVNGALKAGHKRIAVAPGDYYEKITIERDGVSLVGVGTERPRLYFDAYAGMADVYHRDDWGTPGSATVTVNARQVTLENLHIENSFDFLANDARDKSDPARVRHAQAVALLLDVDSDLTLIRDSRIAGFQDTVFADGGRSYFLDSTVAGNVDFIFGDGLAVFERCRIVSRVRAKNFSEGDTQGHITAPSTDIEQTYGLVFIDSRLEREIGVPDASTSLGRPWHPTTTFADGRYADPNAIGSAIYLDTWMDGHIRPEGWASMRGTARDGTKSRVFTPAQSRFFELGSTGAGSATHPARRSLTAGQLDSLETFIDSLRERFASRL